MPDHSYMAGTGFAQILRLLGGCIYWILIGRTKRPLKAELEMEEHYIIHGWIIALPVILVNIYFIIMVFILS